MSASAARAVSPQLARARPPFLASARWQRAALVAAGGLGYATSLTGPFLFDDATAAEEVPMPTRPLTWATWLLNRALSGSDTWSFHLLNVVVHLGAGLLLHALVGGSLARSAAHVPERARSGLAFLTALFWLVHPLQTQSVAYLSQRAEALAAFFVLAALLALLRSVEGEHGTRWRLVSLLAFALGLASKETAATAPVLLLLYDRTFLAGSFGAALRRRRGFYAGLAAVWLVLVAAFASRGVLSSEGGAGFGLATGPLEYARTQPGVVLHYLRLAVWPHPLCLDHGWPLADERHEYVPQTLAVGAALAAVAWALVRRPALGFAGASFFVLLAPSSSCVPILDPAAEHRMYLPLAAVLLLALLAGWRLGARAGGALGVVPRAAVAVLAAAAMLATVRRNHDYRSAVRMWTTVVACAPSNPRAHCNLAYAFLDEGRPEEAIPAAEHALRLRPDFTLAHVALGSAHLARHASDPTALGRAIESYGRALALDPSAAAHNRLANALDLAGDFAAAEEQYRAALGRAPDDGRYAYGLGNALARQGRTAEAVAAYQEALRLRPELQEAHTNLGAALGELGRHEEALAHARRALELPPDTGEEHFNLGRLLLVDGDLEGALAHFRRACTLDDELVDALQITARILATRPESSADERREAVDLAERAAALARPPSAIVLETLGLAHAGVGDHARAVPALVQALALLADDPTGAARVRARLEESRARLPASR